MYLYNVIGDGHKLTTVPKSTMLNSTSAPLMNTPEVKSPLKMFRYLKMSHFHSSFLNTGFPDHNLKFNPHFLFPVFSFLYNRFLPHGIPKGILFDVPAQIDTPDVVKSHLFINHSVLRMRRF
jgi:hypothetical protein